MRSTPIPYRVIAQHFAITFALGTWAQRRHAERESTLRVLAMKTGIPLNAVREALF